MYQRVNSQPIGYLTGFVLIPSGSGGRTVSLRLLDAEYCTFLSYLLTFSFGKIKMGMGHHRHSCMITDHSWGALWSPASIPTPVETEISSTRPRDLCYVITDALRVIGRNGGISAQVASTSYGCSNYREHGRVHRERRFLL